MKAVGSYNEIGPKKLVKGIAEVKLPSATLIQHLRFAGEGAFSTSKKPPSITVSLTFKFNEALFLMNF